MNTILFLLQHPTTELDTAAASLSEAGFLVLSETVRIPEAALSADLSSDSENAIRSSETLVITDTEAISEQLCRKGIPVVGFEHDGIRLSTPEIIDSLEALTPEYCNEVFLSLTGRGAVYENDSIALYPLTEDEFAQAFNLFRREPYMLSEAQRNFTDAEVRALCQSRRILSQFRGNYGTYRVVQNGETIGFGSVFEDTLSDDQTVTTIDFLILPECRGNGLGRTLVKALLAAVRRDDPKLTVYALVHPDNTACIALLSSCGFVKTSEHSHSSSVTQADAPQETLSAPRSRNSDSVQTPHASRAIAPLVYCHRGHQ